MSELQDPPPVAPITVAVRPVNHPAEIAKRLKVVVEELRAIEREGRVGVVTLRVMRYARDLLESAMLDPRR